MKPLIAHIVYALDTGGLENGLVNIINRLDTDFRHLVICLTSAGQFQRRIRNPEVTVIELHKPPGHSLATYFRLWKLLRQYRPALVHSRNLAALEAQLVTLALPGIKRVHGEHGRDVSDLDGSNWKYNGLRKLLRPWMHHYIAVSQDLRHWLLDRIGVRPDRVSQIYNGVDNELFGRAQPGEKNADQPLVIGTVGRLAAVKDQQTLLQAFARLRTATEGFDLQLLIVGDGPLRAELEALARELGIDGATHFAGDSNDVPALLQEMDIFVLPSLAEGISNTLLEAMASGLPIVATRVGGTPEIIDHQQQGLLVPSQQPQALADALAQLVRDPATRQTMGDSGRDRIESRFSWESTVDSYRQIYKSLIEGQSVPVPTDNSATQNIG